MLGLRLYFPGNFGYGLILVICMWTFVSFAEKNDQVLPLVSTASVPTYPRIALAAHISGTVKVIVTTDGSKVSTFASVEGPQMLVDAAETNIRTWKFEPHQPITFSVFFEYRIEGPSECEFKNPDVVLHLPLSVVVSSKGLEICDETKTVTRIIK